LRNAVSIVDASAAVRPVGTVLDPVLALRHRVKIAPGETARIAFGLGWRQAARRCWRSSASIATGRRSNA